MASQLMATSVAVVPARAAALRLCLVDLSDSCWKVTSRPWHRMSCYYYSSTNSKDSTAGFQNHQPSSKSCGFQNHQCLQSARCSFSSHVSYNSRHTPAARHPLHHVTGLNLQPSPSHFMSQRHFSRETFAYYLSSDFAPIGFAKTVLINIHDVTGLPWWATIMMTTFCLRTIVTLPFSIYSTYILAKVESLGPEIGGMSEQLKKEVAVAKKKFGWDHKTTTYQFNINMRRLVQQVYQRENCHPLKSAVIMFIQLPMWFSFSLALRNMAGALPIKGAGNMVQVPSLAAEGMLWFPNLLLADSTFILPVTLGMLNLAITEMHALRVKEPTKKQRAITNFFRGLSLAMVPVGAIVPSCMCLYWTCSSTYGFLQNVLIRLPSVRRACRIPNVPSESPTPYKDMLKIAQSRFVRKKKGENQES